MIGNRTGRLGGGIQRGGRTLRIALGVSLALVFAGAFAGMAASPASAAGTTLWVNNTVTPGTAPGTSCADPGYSTIEAAIAAASSGDTIHVCPGTYTETAAVTTSDLTLQGSDPATGGASDSSCTSSMTPDPSVDTVIDQANDIGLELSADDVTLENFWVQDNTEGDGVYTTATSSGYTIENNVFYNNVFGLYFNSGGTTQSVAEDNCFSNNNVTGAANGNGIYEDQGITNAEITDNSFVDNTNSAIVLVSETDVTISDNSSNDDAALIALFEGTGGTITGNNVDNDPYGGMYVCGANGLDIDHNTVVATVASEPGAAGTYIDGPDDTQQSPPCAESTDLTIDHNQYTGLPYGFYTGTGDMTGSTVEDETATNSTQDGIYTGTGGNTFEDDTASGSTDYDCQDSTSGSGTDGTDNTWTSDIGTTASPSGICSAPSTQTPESPLAVALPLSAALPIGGIVLLRRRRSIRST
jgi:hypothetical protein